MLAKSTAFVALLLAPVMAFGQALADRVPADAIVYLGWRGAADLGPGYPDSNLKAVVDESQIHQFIDEFLPKVVTRVGRDNEQIRDIAQIVAAIAKPTWQRPAAFFFAGIEIAPNQPPTPHLGMLWQPGSDADALVDQLKLLIAQAQPPFPVKVVRVADLVALMVGYDNPEAALGSTGKCLADDDNFKSSMARLIKDPVGAAYVNYQKLFEMIISIAHQADPQAADLVGKVRDNLGLAGLKHLTATTGFDGKDWGTEAFVQAPAPRSGLLKLIGGDPLSDQILTAIPKTATTAGAFHADFSSLIGTIRTSLQSIQPPLADQLDSILKQLGNDSGVNVEKDLLGSLGDEWAYFTDPTIGGRGLASITFVNRLKDPARFEKSLSKIEDFALEQIEQQLDPGDHPELKFQTVAIDNLTIHYLAVPLLAPCWTVHDGNLYVAAFPQVAAAAARRGASPNSSIAQNPGFIALRARLGQTAPSSFSFQDLPQTAPDAYGAWLLISRIPGIADLFGVKSPPLVLPELQKLMTHLSPAGSVGWADAQGFHFRAIEPFPGSTVVASDPAVSALYAQPLAISILLPALNRAREQANRVKSASNLRQIGIASLMYANAHQGRFAPDLGILLQQEDISPAIFFSPRSSRTPPPQPADARERMAWVRDNTDYVYTGADKTSRSPANAVIAHEKLDENTEGVNVLFADGRVEFLQMSEANRIIHPNSQ